MQDCFKLDKLNFLTAGVPIRAKNGYQDAFSVLDELNLDGMELEFVHGVRIADESKNIVKSAVKDKNFILTAHAPFFINLNSQERDKVDASVQRIIETCNVANELGAYSITFHAAYYMGKTKKVVYNKIRARIQRIINAIGSESNVWIRPETTGKQTQWGDYSEIIELSKEFDCVLPCIDFSHIHARENGLYNTYDEFASIFDKIGSELGDVALQNFHAHIAGIEYTAKGERKHLNLLESDFNYKDLLKAFKDFGVKGVVVCESPNIEEDTMLLKQYYMSL